MSGKQLWLFMPVDSWFFRDGTPFNQDGPQFGVMSIFPPSMSTLQGAIRTQLARQGGWTPGGRRPWPNELGDSDSLGVLRLQGPYLRHGSHWLFPVPAHLLGVEVPHGETNDRDGASSGWRMTRLVPRDGALATDLGSVRLPVTKQQLDGAAPLNGWLTEEGLEAVLASAEGVPSPKQFMRAADLYKQEYRVGLARDQTSRTAIDGQLYSSSHVRLVEGVSLAVIVEGVPDGWQLPPAGVVPLGGESRLARLEVKMMDQKTVLPAAPKLEAKDGRIWFTVSLQTPGCFDDTVAVLQAGPPGVPGKCLSACVGKLQQVGGWDLARHAPRPLRPVIPAGSTWFFQADARETNAIGDLHGKMLGVQTEYGYGQIVIGKW